MTARRVLVATDGSELAVHAARRGLELLGDGELVVTVLSVVQPPPLVAAATGMPEGGVAADPALLDREREALEAEGKAAVDAIVAAFPRSVRRVEHGSPGPVICEVAAEEGVDVVVLGSHGSGFVRRVFMGSVSHHVLHHAPCPVLVVRNADRDRTAAGE